MAATCAGGRVRVSGRASTVPAAPPTTDDDLATATIEPVHQPEVALSRG